MVYAKVFRGISYFLIGLISILIVGYAIPSLANAQQATANPNLEIEKTIWNPRSDEWQTNIDPKNGSNPYTFEPEKTVKFRLVIKNTGDVEIQNIEVWDDLPEKAKYESGDGSPQNSGKKVVFSKFNLNSSDSKTLEFKGRLSDSDDFSEGITCLENTAKLKATHEETIVTQPDPSPQNDLRDGYECEILQECDDEECECEKPEPEPDPEPTEEIVTTNIEKKDDASFCVRKPGETEPIDIKEEITVLPKTGSNDSMLFLTSTTALMAMGVSLRSFAKIFSS